MITAPAIIERVFQAAGKRMYDYLDLIALDPFYRIYFGDGSHLDYTGDKAKMEKDLAKFSPKDAANYRHFLRLAEKMYKAVIVEGLGSQPFMRWIDFIKFAPRILWLQAIVPNYMSKKS